MDVEMIGSSFGGGWAIPRSDIGADTLREFFTEEPTTYPMGPLSEEPGYIVEPWQVADLAEHLTDSGVEFGS